MNWLGMASLWLEFRLFLNSDAAITGPGKILHNWCKRPRYRLEVLVLENRTIRWISLLCCLTGCVFTASRAQSVHQIESVEISPSWSGPKDTGQVLVVIKYNNGVFERTWNPATITPEYNSIKIIAVYPGETPVSSQEPTVPPSLSHDIVPERSVLELIHALSTPAIEAPSLSNLGITEKWLEQRAGDVAKHFGNLGEVNDERQQAFIRRSLTDLGVIGKTLPRVVRSSWTDDYPWVHVTVHFSDGKLIQIETRNQPAFMLPWSVQADGKTVKTFNADISRAVAALLPDGSVNKTRLDGEGLMNQIVFQLPGTIRERWQEIGTEDQASSTLDRLREKYSIRWSEVSEHNGLHFGPEGQGAGVKFLQADVRTLSFPKNLVVASTFSLKDGNPVGVEGFLQKGAYYENLVLKNDWIMDSLKRHPNLGAWLIYVSDSSMSEKAMRVFAADMHMLGRDDLAKDVEAHRLEIADLSFYGDEILLFPDHHAILWRWDPNIELFDWPASRVKTERCTDYHTLNVQCSAAVVAPDGQLRR